MLGILLANDQTAFSPCSEVPDWVGRCFRGLYNGSLPVKSTICWHPYLRMQMRYNVCKSPCQSPGYRLRPSYQKIHGKSLCCYRLLRKHYAVAGSRNYPSYRRSHRSEPGCNVHRRIIHNHPCVARCDIRPDILAIVPYPVRHNNVSVPYWHTFEPLYKGRPYSAGQPEWRKRSYCYSLHASAYLFPLFGCDQDYTEGCTSSVDR